MIESGVVLSALVRAEKYILVLEAELQERDRRIQELEQQTAKPEEPS
jgi:hypothetical protein